MPLCARCQGIFHAKQRGAGIDLQSTPNSAKRWIRALKMTFLFAWMLLDLLDRQIEAPELGNKDD
jgi:hypothetical protein